MLCLFRAGDFECGRARQPSHKRWHTLRTQGPKGRRSGRWWTAKSRHGCTTCVREYTPRKCDVTREKQNNNRLSAMIQNTIECSHCLPTPELISSKGVVTDCSLSSLPASAHTLSWVFENKTPRWRIDRLRSLILAEPKLRSRKHEVPLSRTIPSPQSWIVCPGLSTSAPKGRRVVFFVSMAHGRANTHNKDQTNRPETF